MNQSKKQAAQAAFILAAAGVLTACASTSPNLASPQPSIDAQAALGQAVKSQMYSSFSYQTDFYVSNQLQVKHLETASPEQLAAADNPNDRCEHEHDQAYVALLNRIDVQEADFLAVKKTYQDCVSQNNQAAELDLEAFLQETEGLDEDARMALLLEAYQDPAQTQDGDVDYDSDHTALDLKKSQLIDAYLIQPSKFSIQGSYQPLAGKITSLPTWDYQAKNLTAHINQPFYFDLKKGVIYIWADHLAVMNGMALDKQLGNNWQNKWLALPLNDGSLPASFAKDFMGFIIQAQKDSFYSLDKLDFQWVEPKTVLQLPHLMENLPQEAQDVIQKTTNIIKKNPSHASRTYARYVFADSLKNAIIGAYPEFSPEVYYDERQIVEGESVIHVFNATDNPINNNHNQSGLNSRLLLQLLVNYLDTLTDSYQESLLQPPLETPYEPLSHYGIKGGQINWVHHRYYLNENSLTDRTTGQTYPILVDSLTTISPSVNSRLQHLPKDAQTPTATNSVNLFDYAEQLSERIALGQDSYLAGLFGLIFGGEEMPLDEPLDDLDK